jgi:hypothetical protein
MKSLRNLAAGLLLLTGALHLISLVLVTFDPTSLITLLFGMAYLTIGFFLFRDDRAIILWLGAIVPLVGLLLAAIGMVMNPTLLGAIFIAIDIIIATCCFMVIFRKKQNLLSQ